MPQYDFLEPTEWDRRNDDRREEAVRMLRRAAINLSAAYDQMDAAFRDCGAAFKKFGEAFGEKYKAG